MTIKSPALKLYNGDWVDTQSNDYAWLCMSKAQIYADLYNLKQIQICISAKNVTGSHVIVALPKEHDDKYNQAFYYVKIRTYKIEVYPLFWGFLNDTFGRNKG